MKPCLLPMKRHSFNLSFRDERSLKPSSGGPCFRQVRLQHLDSTFRSMLTIASVLAGQNALLCDERGRVEPFSLDLLIAHVELLNAIPAGFSIFK